MTNVRILNDGFILHGTIAADVRKVEVMQQVSATHVMGTGRYFDEPIRERVIAPAPVILKFREGSHFDERNSKTQYTADEYTEMLYANPFLLFQDEIVKYFRVNGQWFCGPKELSFDDLVALALVKLDKGLRKIQNAHVYVNSGQRVEGRTRMAIPDAVKVAVWNRDAGVCVECRSEIELQYDHVIPFSKGGSDEVENIQLLCRVCNQRKGASLTIHPVSSAVLPQRRNESQRVLVQRPAIEAGRLWQCQMQVRHPDNVYDGKLLVKNKSRLPIPISDLRNFRHLLVKYAPGLLLRREEEALRRMHSENADYLSRRLPAKEIMTRLVESQAKVVEHLGCLVGLFELEAQAVNYLNSNISDRAYRDYAISSFLKFEVVPSYLKLKNELDNFQQMVSSFDLLANH